MNIETDRLVIRSFELTDLSEFKKLLDIKEIPGWGMQKNRAKVFLEWHISNYAEMNIITGIICFGIFDKITGRIIGAIGVGEHDDLHETEIFYHLLQNARGWGYVTEAVKVLTDWVLKNYKIDYLVGTVMITNIASQKVLECYGYKLINEQTLLVHIEDKKCIFKYYRYYP